jgi:hypothetical protein
VVNQIQHSRVYFEKFRPFFEPTSKPISGPARVDLDKFSIKIWAKVRTPLLRKTLMQTQKLLKNRLLKIRLIDSQQFDHELM